MRDSKDQIARNTYCANTREHAGVFHSRNSLRMTLGCSRVYLKDTCIRLLIYVLLHLKICHSQMSRFFAIHTRF